MDALILSVGTGGGHNAAGMAVKEELIRRGHNAVMINPYNLKSEKVAKEIDNTYIKLVQKAPKMFGVVYGLGSAYSKLPFRSPIYFVNRRMALILKDYLDAHHYDVIIMPHLFPAEIITNLKDMNVDIPKTVFVATDYACTPFTGETDCDAYILPSEKLKDEFLSNGIDGDKAYSFGIPSNAGCRSNMTKKEAAERLGLDPSFKYILVAGGSMGSGKLTRVIKYLYNWSVAKKNTKIIAICGTNDKLFEKLYAEYGDNIILLRRTDRMAEYMKACDVFLTKPGGLSTTEAAAAGVPIVHITPIPGCESKNMRYFGQEGMSVSAKTRKKSLVGAMEYLEDSCNRLEMIQRQHEGVNSNAASDICDLCEALANCDSDECTSEQKEPLMSGV